MRSGNTEGSPSAISKSKFVKVFTIIQQQRVNFRCYHCFCPEHVLDKSWNVTFLDEALDTFDIDNSQHLLCISCSENLLCADCETRDTANQWVDLLDKTLCHWCCQKNGIGFCQACMDYRMDVRWYPKLQIVGEDDKIKIHSACHECRVRYALAAPY